MDTIATYTTLIAAEAAALPRFLAWSGLFGALAIWLSGWRGWAAACISLALVGAALAIAGLFNMTNALADGYRVEPDVLPPQAS